MSLEDAESVPYGSHLDAGDTGDKAFDGNIGTYNDAAGPEESWTGLDFGENKKIASIHYSPSLMGIGNYEGQEYELFCWADNGWKSLEIKPATGQTVEFNAPRGALLCYARFMHPYPCPVIWHDQSKCNFRYS